MREEEIREAQKALETEIASKNFEVGIWLYVY
jgi:hypothetical protein